MFQDVYYLVEPNAALLDLLQSHHADCTEILQEPQLWHNPEADRSSRRPTDHILRVKRAFVVRISDLLRDDPELTLLGLTASEGTEDFDRWWTVRRLLVDDELPDVEEMYNLESK